MEIRFGNISLCNIINSGINVSDNISPRITALLFGLRCPAGAPGRQEMQKAAPEDGF
jgi:hypothetical protein